MAGGVALDEHILDLMLADEARRRGFAISAEDIARERQLFLDTLEDAGVADAERDAEALLATVRRARGLGPVRFDALLRRSALLRAFVRDEVVVNESMIALAHEIEHGEKRLIRVLATQTLAAAQSALDAAVARGIADADAGRTRPAEDAFDRLEARYAALAKTRS